MIRGIGSEQAYIGWRSAIEIVATRSERRLDRTLKARASLGRAAAAGGFYWGKKEPPPDCATFSTSGWCFAEWIAGSCFSVAERCRHAFSFVAQVYRGEATQQLSF